MGQCILLSGGGGADISLVSAEASAVREGLVFVNQNGDSVTGTLGNVTNYSIEATSTDQTSAIPLNKYAKENIILKPITHNIRKEDVCYGKTITVKNGNGTNGNLLKLLKTLQLLQIFYLDEKDS